MTQSLSLPRWLMCPKASSSGHTCSALIAVCVWFPGLLLSFPCLLCHFWRLLVLVQIRDWVHNSNISCYAFSFFWACLMPTLVHITVPLSLSSSVNVFTCAHYDPCAFVYICVHGLAVHLLLSFVPIKEISGDVLRAICEHSCTEVLSFSSPTCCELCIAQ